MSPSHGPRRRPLVTPLAFLMLLAALVPVRPAAPAVPEAPLPPEALDLPSDLRFVMSLDVRRFVRSPFYTRFSRQPGASTRLTAFDELTRRAGVDPERDVERLIVGGFAPPRRESVALAYGTFDLVRLEQALLGSGASRTTVDGVTQYRSADPQRSPFALAIVSPRCLLLGDPGLVAAAGARRGRAALKGNRTLLTVVRRASTLPAFWLASDGAFLSQLDSARVAAGGGMPLGLPPLETLFVTADFEPALTLAITGAVSDATAARQLGEMLQGFLALAALQAAAKPQLAELTRAVKVETLGSEVSVRGTLAYDVVELLLPKPATKPAPPPAPR